MSAKQSGSGRLSRRTLLKAGALAAAAPTMALGGSALAAGNNDNPGNGEGQLGPHRELIEITVAQLQAQLTSGQLTSRQLVQMYL